MHAPTTKGAWVAHLSWPQVRTRIENGAPALLPIGAGSKEHGPHLPLHTDQLQAEWLAEQLLQRFPFLVWPTVTYGYYPAFADYPGSSHLQQQTFHAVVDDIVSGILRHGVDQVWLLNTGISTIETLTQLEQKNMQIHLLNAYAGPRCREVSAKVLENTDGGHADERETSLLLAIAPQWVDMDLAPERGQKNIGPGPLQWRDSHASNYSPSGIVGDAGRASADKGHSILQAILQDLTDTIEQHLHTIDN